MSLYLINLEAFNDRSLMQAMNDIPANSVILFEDIDCMKGSKARAAATASMEDETRSEKDNAALQNGVTLSGLLNALDGFYAPTNVLFMMTTNRVETLDDALLRPGRIDYRLYLGNATDSQRIELYRRFFPQASESEARSFVVSTRSAETMAEFQGMLLAMESQTNLSLEHVVAGN